MIQVIESTIAIQLVRKLLASIVQQAGATMCKRAIAFVFGLLTAQAANAAAVPIAVDDNYVTPENVTLTVFYPGVVSNDIGVFQGTEAANVTGTAHGFLSWLGNGGFTYFPDVNFTGTDSFQYYDDNGGGVISNTATVTIEVVPEPAVLPLFASGLVGLVLLGWRRKQKAQTVWGVN